jgi:hypothetical protein
MHSRHVAEVLAGMTDVPPIGEGERPDACSSPPPPSRRTPGRRSPTLSCRRRSATSARASSTSAPRAVEALPEFEALRDNARDIKNHTLAHLDLYLEAYEEKVREKGGEVHYAETAADARDDPRHLPAGRRATVTKGKTMIAEEIGLNEHPRGARHRAGRDRPRRVHHPAPRRAAEPHHRAGGARHQGAGRGGLPPRPHPPRPGPRPHRAGIAAQRGARHPARSFLAADVGITGANFLIAETGTSVIVTNEGNGDLTQILPRVHIVLASIEKITPTLNDASQILRLLARSATGQEMSGLHDLLHRAAPAGGPGRAGRVPRRHPRQRPLGDARLRVRGDAALHPLRRLHEPLPGLSGGRRPRLRLGLSRTDGRGADADAGRRRQGRAPAQRLDLLRALRGVCPMRSRCRR